MINIGKTYLCMIGIDDILDRLNPVPPAYLLQDPDGSGDILCVNDFASFKAGERYQIYSYSKDDIEVYKETGYHDEEDEDDNCNTLCMGWTTIRAVFINPTSINRKELLILKMSGKLPE